MVWKNILMVVSFEDKAQGFMLNPLGLFKFGAEKRT